MKRRSFLKTLVGIGALSGINVIVDGCVPAFKFNNMSRKVAKFIPVEIELIPFQDYKPTNPKTEIEISDPLLKKYVYEGLLTPYLYKFQTIIDKYKNNKNETIINYKKFKSNVVSAAEQLGITEKDLENLTIHDAVMLSGKIVANKLDYYKNIIISPYSTPDEKGEADRIDNASTDLLWEEGKGVCRNYASLNVAVFKILKDINPNLRNTYINVYREREFEHIYREREFKHIESLFHVWNIVSTVEKKGELEKILITFVDPTWLDTAIEAINKIIANIGEKSEINDENIYKNIYNALDELHFYYNNLIAKNDIAKVYENLGYKNRLFDTDFGADEKLLEYYRSKGFEQRIKICNEILDMWKKLPSHHYHAVAKLLQNSFIKSIEDLTGMVTLEYNEKVPQIDVSKLTEVKKIYERVISLDPSIAKKKDILSMEEAYKKLIDFYGKF